MDTTPNGPPITPIRENISGYSSKLQIRLDEDSSDQEILRAVYDTCQEFGKNQKTGIALQLALGRVVIAVRERGIHKQEPYGTLGQFILVEIEKPHDISSSTVRHAIEMVEGVPGITDKEAKAVGHANLLQVARALKNAAPERRGRLQGNLLLKAQEMPTADFRAELERRKLIRTGPSPRLGTVSFQLSRETITMLEKLTNGGSVSVTVSKLIQDEYGRRFGGRKPNSRQISVEVEHQQTA